MLHRIAVKWFIPLLSMTLYANTEDFKKDIEWRYLAPGKTIRVFEEKRQEEVINEVLDTLNNRYTWLKAQYKSYSNGYTQHVNFDHFMRIANLAFENAKTLQKTLPNEYEEWWNARNRLIDVEIADKNDVKGLMSSKINPSKHAMVQTYLRTILNRTGTKKFRDLHEATAAVKINSQRLFNLIASLIPPSSRSHIYAERSPEKKLNTLNQLFEANNQFIDIRRYDPTRFPEIGEIKHAGYLLSLLQLTISAEQEIEFHIVNSLESLTGIKTIEAIYDPVSTKQFLANANFDSAAIELIVNQINTLRHQYEISDVIPFQQQEVSTSYKIRLVEVSPILALYRGCVASDCSTGADNFASRNFSLLPSNRIFFVYENPALKDLQNIKPSGYLQVIRSDTKQDVYQITDLNGSLNVKTVNLVFDFFLRHGKEYAVSQVGALVSNLREGRINNTASKKTMSTIFNAAPTKFELNDTPLRSLIQTTQAYDIPAKLTIWNLPTEPIPGLIESVVLLDHNRKLPSLSSLPKSSIVEKSSESKEDSAARIKQEEALKIEIELLQTFFENPSRQLPDTIAYWFNLEKLNVSEFKNNLTEKIKEKFPSLNQSARKKLLSVWNLGYLNAKDINEDNQIKPLKEALANLIRVSPNHPTIFEYLPNQKLREFWLEQLSILSQRFDRHQTLFEKALELGVLSAEHTSFHSQIVVKQILHYSKSDDKNLEHFVELLPPLSELELNRDLLTLFIRALKNEDESISESHCLAALKALNKINLNSIVNMDPQGLGMLKKELLKTLTYEENPEIFSLAVETFQRWVSIYDNKEIESFIKNIKYEEKHDKLFENRRSEIIRVIENSNVPNHQGFYCRDLFSKDKSK